MEGGEEGGPGHEELSVFGALLLHPLHAVAPRVPHTHLATRVADPSRVYPDPDLICEKKNGSGSDLREKNDSDSNFEKKPDPDPTLKKKSNLDPSFEKTSEFLPFTFFLLQ